MTLDKTEFDETLAELELHLLKIPTELHEQLFGTIDCISELCRFEPQTTGSAIEVFLKPTDKLLNILHVAREGNLESFLIKSRFDGESNAKHGDRHA